MPNSTHFHRQLLGYLRQYSHYCDLRHLKALGWMVSALICSGQLSLPAWEPYVSGNAQKAQSVERRWRRFLDNERICVPKLYLPLVVAALSGWQQHRIYLESGYDRVMESLLYDSLVGGMLWTSHSVTMASIRTR